MTMGTVNPFEAIATALATALQTQFPQLLVAQAGWPDTKWLTTDGNKPGVFFVEVSESGAPARSRYQPWATDAVTTYYETSRQQLLIQITQVSSTPEERSSLGYGIQQYLINLLQLPLADGQKSLIRYKGDVSPQGETNFYMRHLTFQFQARILQAIAGTPVTTITPRNTINS